MDEREFSEAEAHAILRRSIDLKTADLASPRVSESALRRIAAEAGVEDIYVSEALADVAPRGRMEWTTPTQMRVTGIDVRPFRHEVLLTLLGDRFRARSHRDEPTGFVVFLERGFDLVVVRGSEGRDEAAITVQHEGLGGEAIQVVWGGLVLMGSAWLATSMDLAHGLAGGALGIAAAVGLHIWFRRSAQVTVTRVCQLLRIAALRVADDANEPG